MFIRIKTTTGMTTIRSNDISAVTFMAPVWEIHMKSGTIFRTQDGDTIRNWGHQAGKISVNGIPNK